MYVSVSGSSCYLSGTYWTHWTQVQAQARLHVGDNLNLSDY